ncbi:MAG: AtpZ/AtpI family protein [Pararhodobacter sp.]|nr:AtpZ/AtpI family protein [Pararhodobacter sp.]
MPEPDEAERLRQLDERISRLRAAHEPPPPRPDGHALGQVAWRMVTELVAGLLVGFGIGFGLDVLLGTQPWFLLLFTLLGLAAGIRTMMRTAAGLQRQGEEEAAAAARDREGTKRG